MNKRRWTTEEIARLTEAYADRSTLDLTALASEFGRCKTGVCRKARSMGLTKSAAIVNADPVGQTTGTIEERIAAADVCGGPARTGEAYSVGGVEYPEEVPCVLVRGHGGACQP